MNMNNDAFADSVLSVSYAACREGHSAFGVSPGRLDESSRPTHRSGNGRVDLSKRSGPAIQMFRATVSRDGVTAEESRSLGQTERTFGELTPIFGVERSEE